MAYPNFTSVDFTIAARTGFETAAPHEMAFGDFNGDGLLDVTLSYFLFPLEDRKVPIRVMLGDGKGGFTDATQSLFAGSIPSTVHGRQIVVADFNGDGVSDAFFADTGLDKEPFPGARNALFLSNAATGKLVDATANSPDVADFTHSATAGDIDGDGDVDLFVGNQGDVEKYPYFLVNDGTGHFTRKDAGVPVGLHTGDPGITTCLLFDADHDGDLDLFTGPWDPGLRNGVIWANGGHGDFTQFLSQVTVPKHGTTENVIDAQTLDYNGDGYLDLVITTVVDFFSVGAIRFYTNDGTGHFADETALRLPSRASEDWNNRVQFVDINNDGALDMLLSTGSSSPIFLNDGSGIFHQMLGLGFGQSFPKLLAGDINGDGRIDLFQDRGWNAQGEYFSALLATDPPARQDGDANNNGLMGGNGADALFGNGGKDELFAGAGADTLNGGSGDDYLNGGSGIDVAVFASARSAATVAGAADGTISVTSAADGADRLKGVELLLFADGWGGFRHSAAGAPLVANFNPAFGWASQNQYPRHVADVNGDGYADIVGFGTAGVLVSFGSANGSFTGAAVKLADFGQNAGWATDNGFHRELADVNGDGRADILGFGFAGTLVSLAKPDGTFGTVTTGIGDFGVNQGWANQDGFARTTGDVNGDGKADLVGFGFAGALVALGNGNGTFQPVKTAIANFGVNQGWTSDNTFHRAVADVNGDGRADLVGFGIAGTYVALARADGTFADAQLVLNDFGTNQGWASNDGFSRVVADVNGDHVADIVGFGIAGTLVAFGKGDGTFTQAGFDVGDFGKNQGWSSDNTFHREVADINHDGLADIVGFGIAGVLVGANQGGFLI